MKSIITTAFLLISITVFSQFKISVTSLTGYEDNINKAPEEYLADKVLKTKEDLHQSSFYQEGKFFLDYKERWRKVRLSVFFRPEFRYYFSEKNSNRILLNTGVAYLYSFNKNYRWETTLGYKLKDQEGEDLDEPELSTPLGYNTLAITTSLHTRLYKNNRTFIKVSYDIKDFDKSATRDVFYGRYGASLRFQNRHRVAGKRHTAGFRASFYNRDYTLEYYKRNRIRNRTWQYLSAGIFYNLPLNNGLSLYSALDFEKRMDVTNKKFGYNEYEPSLGLGYKDKRLATRLTATYTSRKFDSLKASTTEVRHFGNLNHKYVKLTLKGAYKLNKKVHIVTNNYLFDRKTNNTRISTKSNRSYNKFYSSVGVKYNF